MTKQTWDILYILTLSDIHDMLAYSHVSVLCEPHLMCFFNLKLMLQSIMLSWNNVIYIDIHV